MAESVGVLIVGSGPTGLGAATRLQQHGYKDWLMVDQVRYWPAQIGSTTMHV